MHHDDDFTPQPRAHRPIDPDASEIELIQHLARHLRRGSAVETAPWGLSPHQARALGVIARSELHGRGRRGRGRFARPSPDDADSQPMPAEGETREAETPQVETPQVETTSGPRGLRLGALAEWLQIAPRSATEVVDGLEELALVERTPDPADRRAVLVGLTDKGRTVATEIRAARQAQTETLLDALSEQDRAQLRGSLLTLLEAARR